MPQQDGLNLNDSCKFCIDHYGLQDALCTFKCKEEFKMGVVTVVAVLFLLVFGIVVFVVIFGIVVFVLI